MKQLRFEGYSDDTFGEYGVTKMDDDDCAAGSVRVYQIRSGEDVINVVGQHAGPGGGCWMVGAQLVDEDRPFPPWPMHYEAGRYQHTPCLVIDAPDEVSVELIVPAAIEDDTAQPGDLEGAIDISPRVWDG